MKKKIIFSIVVPLHNKGPFLERTLRSIAIQEGSDFEVIVVDDGSTDNGPEIAEHFDLLTGRLRLIRKKNGGASSARNAGISAALYDYVVLLDADDELLPGALNAYSEMIEQFPECGAYGLGFFIKRNNTCLEKKQLAISSPRLHQKVNYFKGAAMGGSYLTSSSACVRRDVFDAIGVFDESLIQREDPHMWFRIAVGYEIAYCTLPLVIYHHDDLDRVCIKYRPLDNFADSILLYELIQNGSLKKSDIVYAEMIIASNYLAQALQNLHGSNWACARRCLSSTSFFLVNNKLDLILTYFLVYSGCWVFINKISRLRFILLRISSGSA